jgi:hypothetical protein
VRRTFDFCRIFGVVFLNCNVLGDRHGSGSFDCNWARGWRVSIPSILGAIADGRVPRAAAIAVMVAGGLIALAINENPDGYAINDIPDVFVNVVARYIN